MRVVRLSVIRFLRARARRAAGVGGALAAALALAACAQPQTPPTGPAGPGAMAPSAAQARTVDPNRPVLVGLLVPSGAPDAAAQAFAADLEAAARMAAEQRGARIEIRTFDTAAEPSRAASAARAALDAGAAALIGPAYSETTRAVRPVAEAAGATVLSFSSDSDAGRPPVWVLGDLPENEVERIMGYAASQGIGSLALVRPLTPYGNVVATAARDAAPRTGARIVASLDYARSFEGVQEAAATGAPAIAASPADGVLIADGGQALRAVAAFLDYYEVSPRQRRFLGLGQWLGEETLQEPSLRGGWFAAVDPARASDFEARFSARTGRSPHPLAALGYDAVLVVAELLDEARAAGDATPFDAAAVTRAAGYDGARGPFVLTPDGANRRALAVFEVQGTGFAVIDPAPALAPAS